LNTKLADFFSILLERLLRAVQGAGVAFVYEEVDGHRRHVRCVEKKRVCVERGVHLRIAYMRHSDRMHASWPGLIHYHAAAGDDPLHSITVKLDVLSFVDRKSAPSS